MPQPCPICGSSLPTVARVECPGCGTDLVPARFRGYVWLRFAICFGIAVAICWKKHFGPFMVFVVSFYALPILFFWDAEIAKLFPPTRLIPASNLGKFQTLQLSQRK